MPWTPTIPAWVPRLRTQLGKGTPVPGRTRGSRDCGMRTFEHGMGYVSRDEAVASVQRIREWMEREPVNGRVPGSNVWDMHLAASKADAFMEARGRRPLKFYKVFKRRGVINAVQRGKFCQVSIDYGAWNSLVGRSGDPNYRGGHSIGVCGEKRWKDGTLVWLVFDSLEDNRRREIPRGPIWRPRWKVLNAAKVWADKTAPGAEVVCGIFGGGKER